MGRQCICEEKGGEMTYRNRYVSQSDETVAHPRHRIGITHHLIYRLTRVASCTPLVRDPIPVDAHSRILASTPQITAQQPGKGPG